MIPSDERQSPGAGTDWLDSCCWRCGDAESSPDPLGRVLCSSCRDELSNLRDDPPVDPMRFVRGAYWDAHALERCWRCLVQSVDPEDDVGLCRSCFASLSAADGSGPDDPSD